MTFTSRYGFMHGVINTDKYVDTLRGVRLDLTCFKCLNPRFDNRLWYAVGAVMTAMLNAIPRTIRVYGCI